MRRKGLRVFVRVREEGTKERATEIDGEAEGWCTHPRCFFVRVANKGVRSEGFVRVTNAELKAVVLSMSCRELVRAPGKGLSEEYFSDSEGKWRVTSDE
jgi:hypothetical protein